MDILSNQMVFMRKQNKTEQQQQKETPIQNCVSELLYFKIITTPGYLTCGLLRHTSCLHEFSVALNTLARWVRVLPRNHVHLTRQRDVKALYSRPCRLINERKTEEIDYAIARQELHLPRQMTFNHKYTVCFRLRILHCLQQAVFSIKLSYWINFPFFSVSLPLLSLLQTRTDIFSMLMV